MQDYAANLRYRRRPSKAPAFDPMLVGEQVQSTTARAMDVSNWILSERNTYNYHIAPNNVDECLHRLRHVAMVHHSCSLKIQQRTTHPESIHNLSSELASATEL
ncbi:hypothetical protein EDB19DRAFT_1825344 [Suillus lakei]|nr:hypothetical protein EDB19DRAFT_1825344 [Suillus lakei]